MRWFQVIGLYLCAALSPELVARPAQAALSGQRPQRRAVPVVRPAPAVELSHLTTHATYTLRPDRPHGEFSPRLMKSMAALLKCHHTGKRHAISNRLIEVLYATARHFNSGKLHIIAGYRAPRIARQKGNPKSPHKRGVACDFRLEGVGIEKLRDYLRAKYSNVGVGYYPNSGFIHVDVGRRKPAYWIDYSGPGQRARYARSEPASAAPTETAQAPAEEPAVPAEETE